jgi:hypothetical protein
VKYNPKITKECVQLFFASVFVFVFSLIFVPGSNIIGDLLGFFSLLGIVLIPLILWLYAPALIATARNSDNWKVWKLVCIVIFTIFGALYYFYVWNKDRLD